MRLLFGIVGLALARTAAQARTYLVFGGVIYLVLFVAIANATDPKISARSTSLSEPASGQLPHTSLRCFLSSPWSATTGD